VPYCTIRRVSALTYLAAGPLDPRFPDPSASLRVRGVPPFRRAAELVRRLTAQRPTISPARFGRIARRMSRPGRESPFRSRSLTGRSAQSLSGYWRVNGRFSRWAWSSRVPQRQLALSPKASDRAALGRPLVSSPGSRMLAAGLRSSWAGRTGAACHRRCEGPRAANDNPRGW